MSKSWRSSLAPIASLKLTVLLFALAIVLIFFGTLAQTHMGNWQVVNTYFRSLWLMMPLGYGIEIPFPGGYTLGGLMVVNLIAAHLVRFKFTWKRAGIIITHLGLILLIVGEVLTGLFAVEWQMNINEGQSVNYAQDTRSVELAIVDPSPADHDNVAVIPGSMLAKQEGREAIRNPRLPFDVRVIDWMTNSLPQGPQQAGPAVWQTNRATEGYGKMVLAVEATPATGVDNTINNPAAYIELSRDGKPLGTWLVSMWTNILGDPRQAVTVDGKTYLIQLRYVRDYKPYTMHLIDFRHDKFVGTEKPKNFSSLVRLVDPTRNEDREVLIYMNHPLRYEGETFYQASFKPDDSGTVLQVVRNPSWLLPYISCSMVALGLVLHFGTMLVKFVERTRR